jgi:hypothetical protein
VADRILSAFLERQRAEGLALAHESDLISLIPVSPTGDRYVAEFRCTGLVEDAPGQVIDADHFQVGIWFPDTYLRQADPFRVLTWLGPRTAWHPNIWAPMSAICVGRLTPGTGLVDILYQVFEIVTWNKVTMREDDALNHAACQWARRHRERFPVDRRPLKRRALAARIGERSRRNPVDGTTT